MANRHNPLGPASPVRPPPRELREAGRGPVRLPLRGLRPPVPGGGRGEAVLAGLRGRPVRRPREPQQPEGPPDLLQLVLRVGRGLPHGGPHRRRLHPERVRLGHRVRGPRRPHALRLRHVLPGLQALRQGQARQEPVDGPGPSGGGRVEEAPPPRRGGV